MGSARPHRFTFLSFLLLPLTIVCLTSTGCATVGPSAEGSRDLPAFRQVDEAFYRGGQPTDEGLRQLAAMGIKTIISLRHHTTRMDEERQAAEQLGMAWVNLPMWYWWRPSDKQIQQFLEVATDPARRPIFVHCRLGRNRAGVMSAIYRVARQGWEPDRAYAEGRRFGLAPWNLLTWWLVTRKTPRMFASASDGS